MHAEGKRTPTMIGTVFSDEQVKQQRTTKQQRTAGVAGVHQDDTKELKTERYVLVYMHTAVPTTNDIYIVYYCCRLHAQNCSELPSF